MSKQQKKGKHGALQKRMVVGRSKDNVQETSIVKGAGSKSSSYGDVNPFEVRLASTKFEILGRKIKGVKGNVPQARSNAITSRRKTLLPEYENRFKSKSFIDKRLSEKAGNDSSLLEYKIKQLEASRKFDNNSKANIFSLHDDNDQKSRGGSDNLEKRSGNGSKLTHKGKFIDDYDELNDDTMFNSDEDDDGTKGNISHDVVNKYHFGGFEPADGSNGYADYASGNSTARKSKAEIMDDVIRKSKEYKYNMQVQKEAADNALEALDIELKDIRDLLRPRTAAKDEHLACPQPAINTADNKGSAPNASTAYDQAVNLLLTEKKAVATDRVKTPEEIAQDGFKRLQELEAQRLVRMSLVQQPPSTINGMPVGPKMNEDTDVLETREEFIERKKKELHQSAETMDFQHTESMNTTSRFGEDDEEELTYQNGKLYVGDTIYDSRSNHCDELNMEKLTSEDSGTDEQEDIETYDYLTDSDNMSDLEVDDKDGDGMAKAMDRANRLSPTSISVATPLKTIDKSTTEPTKVAQSIKYESIPFLIPAPQTLLELRALLDGLLFNEYGSIIERILISNNPKLHDNNLKKLDLFIHVLLDFIDLLLLNIFELDPEESIDFTYTGPFSFADIGALVIKVQPFIRVLSDGGAAAFRAKLAMCSQLVEQNMKLINDAKSPSPYRNYLYAVFATYIKAVQLLYPVSDAYHPVSTPAKVLLLHLVAIIKINSQLSFAISTFFINTAYCYTKLSKKYTPEVIVKLYELMVYYYTNYSSTHESDSSAIKTAIGFSLDQVLFGLDAFTKIEYIERETFASTGLFVILTLTGKFSAQYASSSSFPEVFHYIETQLTLINNTVSSSNPLMMDLSNTTLNFLLATKDAWLSPTSIKRRHHLQLQKHKAIGTQSLAPLFEENYVVGKKYAPSKSISTLKRLEHTQKRERKGARRELRMDAAFLATEKLKKTREMDDDRRTKVKKLYSIMEVQQAEGKELAKIKERIKRSK